MRILYPKHLVLQQSGIHSLVLIRLHTIILAIHILIVFLSYLALSMISKLIHQTDLRIVRENFTFSFEIIGEFLLAASLGDEAVAIVTNNRARL